MLKKVTFVFLLLFIITLYSSCDTNDANYGLSEKIKQDEFTIHYAKGDKKSAQDVMNAIQHKKVFIWDKLEINEPVEMNLYLFRSKEQYSEHFPEYSKIYGGFSKSDGVYMLSPSIFSSTQITSKDGYKYYAEILPVHEMTHYYFYHHINPQYSNALIEEGLAHYLANDEESMKEQMKLAKLYPQTSESVSDYTNASNTGASFFYFLEDVYGWNKALTLIKNGNFVETFEKSDKEIIQEWNMYMKNYKLY